ncbi:hypothetical protein [Arcobacter sp. F2176]|uniref:hypothetical protein n=1 Tax=Arcobacter sp. F2176 TaxID=2044511 RepID=UPI00100B9A5F|nr:hypothetical protein [Arcobacter sp. F2176]RXJ82639.1 hypothetical protein CRU95_00820 [Arcobacter sp. F2176]
MTKKELEVYEAFKKLIDTYFELKIKHNFSEKDLKELLKDSKNYFEVGSTLISFENVLLIDKSNNGFFRVFTSDNPESFFSVDDSQLENYLNYLNKK